MQEKKDMMVKVSAPGRLHLGFLDLHGGLGRLYGSLGVGLHDICLELEVRHAEEIQVTGPGSERAQKYAERMLAHLNIRKGLKLDIFKTIPEHAGLGSGTQLALATGTAIARLFEENLSLEEIARIMDRGNRSGIGIGAFSLGGFIVDAGRSSKTLVPPVISNLQFPPGWRFLLVMDSKSQGVHGHVEKQAFGKLAKMDASISAELCRLLLMQVLPAIAEKNCHLFGQGITEIQARIGDYFKSIQAGVYASKEVEQVLKQLQQKGAAGIGQSSWGPTGFAIYGSETDAYHALKEIRLHGHENTGLEFMICRAQNEPGRISVQLENYEKKTERHGQTG